MTQFGLIGANKPFTCPPEVRQEQPQPMRAYGPCYLIMVCDKKRAICGKMIIKARQTIMAPIKG
jgi:hypothetical protein